MAFIKLNIWDDVDKKLNQMVVNTDIIECILEYNNSSCKSRIATRDNDRYLLCDSTVDDLLKKLCTVTTVI